MTDIIWGQIFGALATVATVLSYQVNTKKGVLIIQTVSTSFTCLSYLFLGASAGLVLNFVCIIRNFIYYFLKDGSRANRISAYSLAVIMVILGAISWQGWYSLLMIAALPINTVFLSYGKPQLLRKSILLTSSLIFIYDIFVFSMGGLANESLAIISSIVGIARFAKGKVGNAECNSAQKND
jgi:hypothetical protein